MTLQYYTLYLEILALCFLVAAVIYFNVRRDLGSEWEITAFRWMLIIYMMAIATDAVVQLHYAGAFSLRVPTIAFLYATYMFLVSGMLSFSWILFAESRLGTALVSNRRNFFLALIPALVVGVFSYLTPFTGWFFSLDEAGEYYRGPYWALQNVVAYGYFLLTTIHALKVASKEKSPEKRRQEYALASFIIWPFLGGLLQLIIGRHPFIVPSICLSILFIFISIQSNLIYHDALTGLSNRKHCDQELVERISRVPSAGPFHVFMLDIDRFKKINDNYGHLEGDRCLRIMARVIRETVDEYRGFAGRFGGDEFLCFVDEALLADPLDFGKKLAENTMRGYMHNELPYTLNASVGHARCDDPAATAAALLREADKALYREKAKLTSAGR